ncbi:MAG: PDZ domain-containing protein [Planctomycetes bacterium]|nr:PDZ domain-containing protein [Planctomycetota bacterium]
MPVVKLSLAVLALFCAAALASAQNATKEYERRTPVVVAVERVGPCVVNIQCQNRVNANHSMFPGLYATPQAERDPKTGALYTNTELGAGVVVHADGLIITNEHVIHGAERLMVTFPDGKKRTATLLNSNSNGDLAILRLNEPGPYACALLGNSDALMIGETTIALGNPFGIGSSATSGILSACNRQVEFQGKPVFTDFLQTSADINPGNSGGPLLDINGRVIGINTAIDKRGQGIGYAIPVNRVRETMTEMVLPELAAGISLGLDVVAIENAVETSAVAADGPAQRAGMRTGDRILSVDTRSVASPFDFHVALLGHAEGDRVVLGISRDGKTRTMELTTVGVERTFGTKLLGMEVADLSPTLARHLNGTLPEGLPVGVPVIVNVDADGAAQRIGLKKGDILVAVGRVDVRSTANFISALNRYQRRGGASVRVLRNGKLLEGTLDLATGGG